MNVGIQEAMKAGKQEVFKEEITEPITLDMLNQGSENPGELDKYVERILQKKDEMEVVGEKDKKETKKRGLVHPEEEEEDEASSDEELQSPFSKRRQTSKSYADELAEEELPGDKVSFYQAQKLASEKLIFDSTPIEEVRKKESECEVYFVVNSEQDTFHFDCHKKNASNFGCWKRL